MDPQIGRQSVDYIGLITEIVSAYLLSNHIQPAEIPALIASVHAALADISCPLANESAGPEKPTSTQIKNSVTPDALISFLDGKSYKALKRHLTKHGLDEISYRTRYGLPNDYPMNAPNYSAARSAVAHSIGLGRKRSDAPNASVPVEKEAIPVEPKRRGRPRKAVKAPDVGSEGA